LASARRLYQTALDVDPKNRGARLNLARLDARVERYTAALREYAQVRREAEAAWSGNHEKTWQDRRRKAKRRSDFRQRVRSLLTMPTRIREIPGWVKRHVGSGKPASQPAPAGPFLDEVLKDSTRAARLDNVWYQALYQLAAVTSYRAIEIEAKCKELEDKVSPPTQNGQGASTIETLTRELLKLSWPDETDRAAAARNASAGQTSTSGQAVNLDPEQVIVQARHEAERLDWEAAAYGRKLMGTIDETRHAMVDEATSRGWSNCSPLRETNPDYDHDRQLWQYLDEFAPPARAMYAGCLAAISRFEDAAEQARRLTDDDRSHYQVQYNLACYYSLRGLKLAEGSGERPAAFAEALRLLRQSLTIAQSVLIEWAEKDLSLRGVREDVTTRAGFAEIFTQRSGWVRPSDEASVADLARVGPVHAQQLQDEGIRSIDELRDYAQSAAERETLAKDLRVNLRLVLRWALLADLALVPGMTPPIVNLLDAVDVSSISALKGANLLDLEKRVNSANNSGSFITPPPSQDIIRGWIKQATAAKPVVAIGEPSAPPADKAPVAPSGGPSPSSMVGGVAVSLKWRRGGRPHDRYPQIL
jgi:hypothetical protein